MKNIFGALRENEEGYLEITAIANTPNLLFEEYSNIFVCKEKDIINTTFESIEDLLLEWNPYDCNIIRYGFIQNGEFRSEWEDEGDMEIVEACKEEVYRGGILVEEHINDN